MSRTCKAWVQTGPRALSFEDVPVPDTLADGFALARVEASGLCGSDYEQYRGTLDQTGRLHYPLILGHEPLLRIDRLTPGARDQFNVTEGDRVIVYPLACKVCRYCVSGQRMLCERYRGNRTLADGLWGSLAEYMMIGRDSVVHKVPESVSAQDALLYNPLSGAFEWAIARGRVGVGDDVLILGAGQRGLACVVVCRQAGANRIIVTGLPSDEEKLRIAARLGATDTVVVDPGDPNSLIGQIGSQVVDIAIDVVPVAGQPVLDAIEAVRRGGTVVLSGIKGMRQLPGFVSDKLIFKSLDVLGAFGYSATSQRKAIETVLSGRYDFSEWHTHLLPLDRAEEAIRILGGELLTGRAPVHVTVTGTSSNG